MNYLFIHTVKINDYQRILDEIFSYVLKVKDKIEKIFIVVLGDKNKKIVFPDIDNIEIIYESENIREGEEVTLNLLRNFCIENVHDDNVCYLHMKGLGSNNKNECINDWRNLMLYFNIERIDECISKLDKNDTCGVDLRTKPTLHYSGNFWWAKTSYVSTLPKIKDLPLIISERHKCEFWICSDKTKKHHSLHDCGVGVYERHLHRYEENEYKIGVHKKT